jgi:hypothetical protein
MGGDEHVEHAHTGVSYVFGRMWWWGRWGWSQTQKTRPNGRVFRVFRVVGGEVGGGGLRHKKRAQTGAFFGCFVLWEVREVPDTKTRPNRRVFRVFRVLKRRGGEGDVVG